MLRKIVRKSLGKSKILILAVVILFTLAIGLFTVSKITYQDFWNSFYSFEESSNFEDFRIYTIKKVEDLYDETWQNDLAQNYDVTLEKKDQISIKTTIDYINQMTDEHEDKDTTITVLKYNPSDVMNTPYIIDGELPNNDNEILLLNTFMERQQYQVEDIFSFEGVDYTISGSAYFPDYIFPVDVISGAWSLGTDSFIPVLMNEQAYNRLNQNNEVSYFSAQFNNTLTDDEKSAVYKKIKDENTYTIPVFDENGKPQTTKSGMIKTQEISSVAFILDVKLNPGMTSIEEELNGEQTMFSVLSIIIIVIAILITIVLFNNIFTSQKREMGILKAEGVETEKLSLSFTLNLGIIIFISSVLGVLVGFGFKNIISTMLTAIFNLPIINENNNTLILCIIQILLIDICVMVLVYFVSIRRNLKMKPLVLIKNITKEKEPLFKFEFITKHLSFKNKYKFNIAARNIATSILLAFGVFMSSFLLLSGGMMYTAVNKTLSTAYEDVFTYDYEANYSTGVSDQEYDKYSVINQTVKLTYSTGDKRITDKNQAVQIYAYDMNENDLINLVDEDGNKIIPDVEGVYLSKPFAKLYELEVGDTIKFENPYNTDEVKTVVVKGITNDTINATMYMDISALQNLLEIDSAYANAQVGVGDDETELLKYDPDLVYTTRVDMENDLKTMTALMMTAISMISFIAIIISFVTMSVISNLVIKKNRKVISIMKVLGYNDKEIQSMTTSIYKWILFIVYFVSIPLFQTLIQSMLDYALADLDYSFEIHIGAQAAIFGFIVICLIYFLSSLISKRSIKKISLAESLKADE